jgi:hypothetical protein
MTTRKEWIAYRKGDSGITPPLHGWVDEELQNAQHRQLQLAYIQAATERMERNKVKEAKQCDGFTRSS